MLASIRTPNRPDSNSKIPQASWIIRRTMRLKWSFFVCQVFPRPTPASPLTLKNLQIKRPTPAYWFLLLFSKPLHLSTSANLKNKVSRWSRIGSRITYKFLGNTTKISKTEWTNWYRLLMQKKILHKTLQHLRQTSEKRISETKSLFLKLPSKVFLFDILLDIL